MNNPIESNNDEYIDNIQYDNDFQNELNHTKSNYIKKYYKSESGYDNSILKTDYVTNENTDTVPSNAKKNYYNKNILEDDISDNLSTNRNFNKLITKSRTTAKSNNSKLFDKMLLSTSENKSSGSFFSKLNPNYIRTKYFKDTSTITNLAKRSTKYTFDLIKNNATSINYDKPLERFIDLIIKILIYCGKFIWVLLCNFVLLIKSIVLTFIIYLNRKFSIWKNKNGLEDSLSLQVHTMKKKTNDKNKKNNIQENNIQNKENKNSDNKNSGNKFFNFFSNGVNSINNFINNSYPQAQISKLDNTSDSDTSSIIILPKKPINKKPINKKPIRKYYPIKTNSGESYDNDKNKKRPITKINLKVDKKLGRELKKRIEKSNLKTKKGIKKSLTEMYNLLK